MLDTRKHNRNLLLSYWGRRMNAKILAALQAHHKSYVDELRQLNDGQLVEHLKEKLKEAEQAQVELSFEELIPAWLDENADDCLDVVPAKELHAAMAKHLANGKPLSDKAVQWFAQRVVDPKLLNKKRGPKPKYAYHHQIRRLMRIMVNDLGMRVKDAQELMVAAAPLSNEHVRDLYHS